MDSYFKVLRAQEEVLRLNVEVPRLATFMRDDDAYLLKKQTEIQATHPALSHQIGIYRMEGGRFIVHHTKILNQIVALKGYSGGLLLGTHVADVETVSRVIPAPQTVAHVAVDVTLDRDEDLEAEEAGEDEEREALGAYYSVIQMSIDTTSVGQ
jgi:hypothetical protein